MGGDGVEDDGGGKGKRVLVNVKRAGYAARRIATESGSGVSEGR